MLLGTALMEEGKDVLIAALDAPELATAKQILATIK
jgi:hypothetical protein